MKGQVKQVFVYIMTILIVGLVILIALRSFSRLDETRCAAERVLFDRELGDALQRNLAWGREEAVALTKPCEREMVCFIDSRAIEKNKDVSGTIPLLLLTNLGNGASKVTVTDPDIQHVIRDSVNSGIEKNIFLVKPKEVMPAGFDPHLQLGTAEDLGSICPTGNAIADCPSTTSGTEEIPSYALCIPSRAGTFSFTLIGGGRFVLVKPK
jgi:hypothetical protein